MLRVLTTNAGKVLMFMIVAAFVLAALMVNNWNPVQAVTSVWGAIYSVIAAVVPFIVWLVRYRASVTWRVAA